MRRLPRFGARATCAILLGLIVGSTAAVFGLNEVLAAHPLRTAHADRLVTIWGATDEPILGGALRWWGQAAGLESVASVRVGSVVASGDGWSARVKAGDVSPSFMAVVGCQVVEGNAALAYDLQPGSAVLSEGLWRSVFDAQPTDKLALRLNGETYTVAGVVSSDCVYPRGARIWAVPSRAKLALGWDFMSAGAAAGLPSYVGLLRVSATAEQLSDQLGALLTRANEIATPRTGIRYGDAIGADALGDTLGRRYRPTMNALAIGGAVVSAAAGVNCAVFFLCFYGARQTELATRRALGASPRALLALAIKESAAIGLIAAVVSAIAALVITSATAQSAAAYQLPEFNRVRLASASALMAIVVAFVFASVSALAMLLAVARKSEGLSLINQRSGSSSAVWSRALRGGLLAMEVAAASVLCLGAVTSVQAVRNLQQVDLGYDAADVSRVQVSANPFAAADTTAILAAQTALLDAVQGVHGVASVALMSSIPAIAGAAGQRQLSASNDRLLVTSVKTHGDFAAAAGLRLIGRRSSALEPGEAIVNNRLAQMLSTNGATESTVRLAGYLADLRIVGIVGDTRAADSGDISNPTIYTSFAGDRQVPDSKSLVDLVVRCASGCARETPAVVQAVSAIRPGEFQLESVGAIVNATRGPAQLRAFLWAVYGVVGFAIAVFGVGLIASYLVQTLHRELAIRIALGATLADLFGGVASEIVAALAIGTLAGGASFLAGTQLLSNLLFGVDRLTAGTFASVLALLLTAGIVAVGIPIVRLRASSPARFL